MNCCGKMQKMRRKGIDVAASLDQLRDEKKIHQAPTGCIAYSIFTAIVLVLILIGSWLNFLQKITIFLSLSLTLIILGISKLLSKSAIQANDIIGKILFEAEKITINNLEISITPQNIQSILIHHNHIRGHALFARDNKRDGFATITIHPKTGSPFSAKFVIYSYKEQDSLRQVMLQWYRQKIEIKELIGYEKTKTFALNHNLRYAEIEEIKKEIGIN
jgi:hypothetical protein